MCGEMIPVSRVVCTQEQEDRVLGVVRSGQLAQGAVVEELEAHCRAMTGAAHAVAVNSGTAALQIALGVCDLAAGDEIVTSPFTFGATLNAALATGASVRFADIGESDFVVDPAALDDVVSEATRVVMPVHLYGQAADMNRIAASAERVGAVVVEDAAQAHGATYGGRPVGAWGLAAFSFYATKNMFAGEGGVVTTDDGDAAERMRIIRNQGMRNRYEYVALGGNYRMTDLAAAVVVPQFDHAHETVAARRCNAELLLAELAGIDGLRLPIVRKECMHVWHQFTVRITADARHGRDAVVEGLVERGVGSGVFYPRAVYDYPCFREHPKVLVGSGCPVAERVATEVLSLPVHQHLEEAELATIVAAVRDVLT